MKFIVESVNGVPHFGKMTWKIKCSIVYKMEQFTQNFYHLQGITEKTKWTSEYSIMLKGYLSMHKIAWCL